jgi:hypothetical protein
MKFMQMTVAITAVACATQFAVGQAPAEREQEKKKRDQLRIAVQEICPVSGQKLGSMGAPLKVQVGQETVFLCCKGCAGKKVKPEHWKTIHANFAKAQRICPVMKNDLPKNPKWTIVEGQIVYVCCPPCTKKIAAEPRKYLLAVDALYAATLETRKRAAKNGSGGR